MNALVVTESIQNDELLIIEELINRLKGKFNTIEQEKFADECLLVGQELPYRLRKLLNDFRNRRMNDGYLLLRGFPIDDEAIGRTPSHWDASWINPRILREEIFQCLISSCTGDIFGWLTQENGRYLRHIVPIEKDKNEQLGGSSNVVLLWHVEEAFHPQRADLMSIMCYRNEEKACTNICAVSDLDIPDQYWEILSQKRFFIEPDKSHMQENNESKHWQLNEEHFKKIHAFLENPEPVSVLNGIRGQENLLVDEAFMDALPGDEEAKKALKWLFNHMNERNNPIMMGPGDLLLIDNRMTAHGRSPYVPNYGPKARWLRRVNITADLRKSYQWKDKPYGRVIF
ncbi:MAG: TauD/TfdA family dioxygenase [Verrucomicrobiota bacterium]|nr:TauD/TfdA family dioxygenase [Verrucomicrobiota bacterium]